MPIAHDLSSHSIVTVDDNTHRRRHSVLAELDRNLPPTSVDVDLMEAPGADSPSPQWFRHNPYSFVAVYIFHPAPKPRAATQVTPTSPSSATPPVSPRVGDDDGVGMDDSQEWAGFDCPHDDSRASPGLTPEHSFREQSYTADERDWPRNQPQQHRLKVIVTVQGQTQYYFCRPVLARSLQSGDVVMVDGDRGTDAGKFERILCSGEDGHVVKSRYLLRLASDDELETFNGLASRNIRALKDVRHIVKENHFDTTITIHSCFFQADGEKIAIRYSEKEQKAKTKSAGCEGKGSNASADKISSSSADACDEVAASEPESIQFKPLLRPLHYWFKCRIWMERVDPLPPKVKKVKPSCGLTDKREMDL